MRVFSLSLYNFLISDLFSYNVVNCFHQRYKIKMASSSVSQDDFEKNDFEKLERRSRIRTARARQINPQVKAAPNLGGPYNSI